MNAVQLIETLAATPAKNEKIALIQQAFIDGERQFFLGAQMAYDGLVTFGIKVVAKVTEDDGAEGTFSFADFNALALKLKSRQLTGHAARDAINEAAMTCDAATWNGFYRRILLKDFKAGLTESTINKALAGLAKTHPSVDEYLVPTFGCQLAPSEAMTPDEALKRTGKWFVDVKKDGARLLSFLHKASGEVIQYSRDGAIKTQFPEIVAALEGLIPELPGSIVIDGEVVTSSFRDLSNVLNSKSAKATNARLAIFDIIPMDDFLAGKSPRTQRARHAVLVEMESSGLLQRATKGVAYAHPKIEVDLDTKEGRLALCEFAEQVKKDAEVDKTVEGWMMKRTDAPYECRRSKNWEKVKPTVSVSLTCVGYLPGKAGTKWDGKIGSILFEGEDGDRKIKVAVGSGYSAEEREAWSADFSLIDGLIGEIEGDSFTQNEETEAEGIWSLRFPRLKGWRGGVPGEKI